MATETIDIERELVERLRDRASDVRMSLDEYLGAIAEAEGLVPVSAEFDELVHWALDTYAPLMKRLSL